MCGLGACMPPPQARPALALAKLRWAPFTCCWQRPKRGGARRGAQLTNTNPEQLGARLQSTVRNRRLPQAHRAQLAHSAGHMAEKHKRGSCVGPWPSARQSLCGPMPSKPGDAWTVSGRHPWVLAAPSLLYLPPHPHPSIAPSHNRIAACTACTAQRPQRQAWYLPTDLRGAGCPNNIPCSCSRRAPCGWWACGRALREPQPNTPYVCVYMEQKRNHERGSRRTNKQTDQQTIGEPVCSSRQAASP